MGIVLKKKTAPGSLSTGSPAGRTLPHGDGSMYNQANVRIGKCAAAPYPSVAVRDRGHWEGVAGSWRAFWKVTPQKRVCFRWKGVRPGVRLESRSGEPVRSPKNTKRENCQYTIAPTRERLKLFFLWVNQLSIYGPVSDLCEECDSCHDSTGRLVVEGQSNLLFVPTSSLMETHTPLTDDLAQPEDLLKRYQERVERPYRSRIRNVDRIQIILAQGEWSSAKEAEPIFKRCNKRQWQTFCDMVNVPVCDIGSICIHE